MQDVSDGLQSPNRMDASGPDHLEILHLQALSMLSLYFPSFSHLNDFCQVPQGLHTLSSLPEKLYCFRLFAQSAALCFKKIFPDVIRILRQITLAYPGWVLNAITCLPLSRRQRATSFLQKEKETAIGPQGRHWSDAATRPGMPQAEDKRGDSPPEPLEGAPPHRQFDFGPVLLIRTSDLQNCERINFRGFMSLSLC